VNGIFLRFGLGLGRADVISIIVAVYLCKVALAIVDTPLIYAGRWVVECVLGLEHDPTRDGAPLA
jgi:uncharacterized PurR-regulated membrane protein YhhQ (DUF165 family)